MSRRRNIQWVIETDYGRLGLEQVKDWLFVHCEIDDWSLKNLKDAKKQWTKLLDYLRKFKIERIYSAIHEDDELLNKWQKMWGMEFVGNNSHVNIYKKEL